MQHGLRIKVRTIEPFRNQTDKAIRVQVNEEPPRGIRFKPKESKMIPLGGKIGDSGFFCSGFLCCFLQRRYRRYFRGKEADWSCEHPYASEKIGG